MSEPTMAPGIESSPPITTAGKARSAKTKLSCVRVLNPPVKTNPAIAASSPPINQASPKTRPTLIP